MEIQRSRPGYISPRDLSRVPSFYLGPVWVDPATRSLTAGGRRKTIEPRVMQVLAALGLEPGEVLSRDDLIALCWDGVIVGDNAINRVMSLLRQALAEVSGDAVRLETITKVGFRIVVLPEATLDSAKRSETKAPSRFDRRHAIAGGAALAAVAGASGWLASRDPSIDPRAVKLAQEADLLMKSGLPGSTRQATRNLERAVAIAPQYADGWGQLALMYRHALQGFSAGERTSFPRMVDAAAARALALSPGQPDARLALALKRPFFGRWAEAEKELRPILRDHPRHWYVNAQLSLLLMDVGRAADALPFRRAMMRATEDKVPVGWTFLALNLLSLGRLHEADAALDRAFAVWPNHPALWSARYRILIETGRPAEAAAFMRAPRSRPDGVPEGLVAYKAAIADAIAEGDPAARREVAARVVAAMKAPEFADEGAALLALLGAPLRALDVTRAYFVGGPSGGADWPAPDPYSMRPSAYLFYPSLVALADEPAYRTILAASGLERYWQQSGSQPDFRRR